MKLPLSLIKTFISSDLSPEKISQTLTLLGIEVDGIENENPPFTGVVAGEILSAKPHPNAEKLKIAEVTDGSKSYTVVTAAANCRAGMRIPFAKVGAVLTGSDGKEIRIEKATLRGVESFGMFCSGADLRISKDESGLLELPVEMKAGADLLPLLWDPVFEISLTPNLGHCMSALGLARELAASLQEKIRHPKFSLKEAKKPLDIALKIKDEKAISRYMGRLVDNVTIGPSPLWLKLFVERCGMKSINNAVDAANYIMMQWGQPLHVFDCDKIEGNTVEVSLSHSKTSFLGLDEIKRELPTNAILISDKKKPIAIAGILGSLDSAVSEKTTRILIEAASFNPELIRSASKHLGLRTESSQRFEKGVDPTSLEEALSHACQLLIELTGGELAKGSIEATPTPLHPKKIRCRIQRANQLLGTKLSFTEAEEIFERLTFKTKAENKESLLVEVPLYRKDVATEIDLIEEIARIYGYNNIEKSTPKYSGSTIPHDPLFLFENKLRQTLSGLGFQEFLNCDLQSPKLFESVKELISSKTSPLKAIHSKSEEYSILRTSLLPGLLESAKRNIDQKNQTIHAFEIGCIHFAQEKKVVEIPMLALLLIGKSAETHWGHKPTDVDFFNLKGSLETLLDRLKAKAAFEPSMHLSFHPGRQADLRANNHTIGSLGEVHPNLLAQFDIKQKLYYAEINLFDLIKLPEAQRRMTPLAQFPASERDWTVTLPYKTPIAHILSAIQKHATPLLENVELIDLYTPQNGDEKNATFRFTYRDLLKTISFEEVENEHGKLLEKVSSEKLLAK